MNGLMRLVGGAVLAAVVAVPLAMGVGGASHVAAAGCNEVVVPRNLARNTPVASILSLVMGSYTVSGIFRYNNRTHSYDALFFSATGAPVDASTVDPLQSIFICGTGSGSFPTGAF